VLDCFASSMSQSMTHRDVLTGCRGLGNVRELVRSRILCPCPLLTMCVELMMSRTLL